MVKKNLKNKSIIVIVIMLTLVLFSTSDKEEISNDTDDIVLNLYKDGELVQSLVSGNKDATVDGVTEVDELELILNVNNVGLAAVHYTVNLTASRGIMISSDTTGILEYNLESGGDQGAHLGCPEPVGFETLNSDEIMNTDCTDIIFISPGETHTYPSGRLILSAFQSGNYILDVTIDYNYVGYGEVIQYDSVSFQKEFIIENTEPGQLTVTLGEGTYP